MRNRTSTGEQRLAGSGHIDRPAARGARAGLAGGLAASVPVIGPVLGAFCTSCLGIAGASVAGAVSGWDTLVGLTVGIVLLTAYGWFVIHRARRRCSAEECRRLTRRLPLLLGASGAASYLMATFVVVPFLREAALQLSRAFNHVP